ncbi:HlyC/CorC family transporter [Cyanobacterium stanieri LEGE 03274]|uniref:HlyC/CorC family transporter n=1 Tax=Cyanobacterium stanieri LEGE 03274 TaxID=1828756 RepID=A0ABR9V0H9_9CHRO|nr:hemolysin family protein [Cyanobacterium stanieri]MBE9221347.1 HlyC/CorC family transporter [Cyanobacterium stanieri LEGE 03274]
MLTLLLVVVIVLLGSAFCSLTETVLLSVSEIRVKQWAQSKKAPALALLKIKQKINRPIASIVILNNIFNIVGSIIIGGTVTQELGDKWLGLFSGLLTFLIIIFGEILPKTLGQRYAEPLSLSLAIPVKYITFILTPIVWVLEKVTQPLTKGQVLPTTNETEIRFLTRIGKTEGVIEPDEAEMIHRVFHLNDLSASDLMTPRILLTYVKGDLTLGECQDFIINSEHTRILIIDDTIDNVIGTALKQELLTAIIEGKKDQTIAQLARPANFVPETMRADYLLKKFQNIRQHLVVVIDEYGGVAGVVSLEDVLEVLTGDIVDETDKTINLQEIARKKRERLLVSKGLMDS